MTRRQVLRGGAAITAASAGSAAADPRSESPVTRRQELYSLLGDLPARDRPISVKTISVEERPEYVLEKLELDLNGLEPVPAYFVRPKGLTGRAPGVLFNHSHGNGYTIGKEEFIHGRKYLVNPPYAEFLTSLGYSALCIDAWIFGERATRTELDAFKEMLWNGRVLWGMMVYDGLRALDYLISRPEVDPHRVGTVGISMGSDMAQYLAALDPRIKVCVDICCLTDFQALIEAHSLKDHGIYYYVPSLLKHFTAAQINGLTAPRAHLSLAGNQDTLTPVAGLERIDRELRRVYLDAGHPEQWKLLRYEGEHRENDQMRAEIQTWFTERL